MSACEISPYMGISSLRDTRIHATKRRYQMHVPIVPKGGSRDHTIVHHVITGDSICVIRYRRDAEYTAKRCALLRDGISRYIAFLQRLTALGMAEYLHVGLTLSGSELKRSSALSGAISSVKKN